MAAPNMVEPVMKIPLEIN